MEGYIQIKIQMVTKQKKLKKQNKSSKKKPRFRIRSKTFFLTYPQVPAWATESMFLECYREIFPKREHEMMEYLIGKELHQDGNPHMHVFLEFPFTNDVTRKRLHVTLKDPGTGENVVIQGSYESAKKKYSVMKYILKDLEGEAFTNIRLLIYRDTIHEEVESYLLHIAQYDGVEVALRELLDHFPEYNKNIIRFRNGFRAIRQAERDRERQKLLLSRIKPLDSYVNVPIEALE